MSLLGKFSVYFLVKFKSARNGWRINVFLDNEEIKARS
jgi:hypothetical protein